MLKPYTNSPAIVVPKMRSWWNERIEEGCQLSDLDLYVKGMDYELAKNSKWLSRITVSALRADFAIASGLDLGIEYFSTLFNSVTGITERERKVIKIPTRGGNYTRSRIRYVCFGKPVLTRVVE